MEKSMQPFSIDKDMEPLRLPDDIVPSPLNRQPINTNPAFSTNYRLMIPKVRDGIYFCTEVVFPSMTMDTIKIPILTGNTLRFYGNKIEHGDLAIKFVVNDDFSNWKQMSEWFSETLDYYGFFRADARNRLVRGVTDSSQLLILNNKRNPVARVVFDNLFITSLGSLPMTSTVADNTTLSCDATFQFTSFDILDP